MAIEKAEPTITFDADSRKGWARPFSESVRILPCPGFVLPSPLRPAKPQESVEGETPEGGGPLSSDHSVS